jgi:hypothetical protein
MYIPGPEINFVHTMESFATFDGSIYVSVWWIYSIQMRNERIFISAAWWRVDVAQ